jgi:hypothetical protein
MLRPALLAACAIALAVPAQAQPLQDLNDGLFQPLDLPAPNVYRSGSGAPGPEYWQQRADYQIEAALDTVAHRVTGTVEIAYANNSPEALSYLWLHLEQNLFRPDSRGAALTPTGSRWRGSFAGAGFDLGTLQVDAGGMAYEPASTVTDTRMRVDLAEPLPPGGRLVLTVPYAFTHPEYGADRHGRFEAARGTVYEFAQWYPRMAVYDDVSGWDTRPYLGQGEFYLGYGDFDLALTVPASMTVVATGALQNEAEVFTATQRQRLAEARQSDERVYIVEPGEVGTRAASPSMTGTMTWRYRAENVRDVAWAASNAFILDAAAYEVEGDEGPMRGLAMAAYPEEGIGTPENPGWEEATLYTKFSIEQNSVWYPYPYPVAISVAGIVGGMEYPMLHFSSVDARDKALFGVVDHEIAHNWFPMIVGSDERAHVWMDEGFASFMGTFANRVFYGEDAVNARVVRLTTGDAAAGFMREPYSQDQVITTAPDQIRRQALGFLAYRKPAKGLMLLREQILGPERFDAAFKAYIRRWAFKHPQPADFFRTMEDIAGDDLSYFWRGWFMTTGQYDVAVDEAAPLPVGDGTMVRLVNKGDLVLPVDLQVTFAGGEQARYFVPAEAFAKGDEVFFTIPDGREVTQVIADPDGHTPDQNRDDNSWAEMTMTPGPMPESPNR